MSDHSPKPSQRAHSAQSTFRAVLDAMARPGTLVSATLTEPEPDIPSACLQTLLLTLCDSNTSFCVAEPANQQLGPQIARLTRARQLPPDVADFAILPVATAPQQAARFIGQLAGGSLLAPERSATVLVECELLSAEPQAQACWGFCLRGPGIASSQTFYAGSDIWQRARAARADEFPCGIDFIFYDRRGTLVCLPRTTLVQALGKAGHGAKATGGDSDRADVGSHSGRAEADDRAYADDRVHSGDSDSNRAYAAGNRTYADRDRADADNARADSRYQRPAAGTTASGR